MHPRQDLPSFTGLVVHRDAEFGFSVLIPDGWQRLAVEGSSGVFYAPDERHTLTGLAIEARDLGTDVRPDDLPALRRGFLRGLRELPECHISSREAERVGGLLNLEARHTFRDGEATRMRWVRVLYQGRTQVRLIAQAESVERFEYWEPMFYTSIRTFRFGSFA